MKKLFIFFLLLTLSSIKLHAQTPYVGEIRMFAGNFAPAGWAFCDGSLLSIAEYETLFTIIGTTYGGNGQQTFGVPDLRGRMPLGQGSNSFVGQVSGSENVILTQSQIPNHNHSVNAVKATGTQNSPTGNLPADTKLWDKGYSDSATSNTSMSGTMIRTTGQSQPVDLLKPYLTVNFIISLYGIYPSQN